MGILKLLSLFARISVGFYRPILARGHPQLIFSLLWRQSWSSYDLLRIRSNCKTQESILWHLQSHWVNACRTSVLIRKLYLGCPLSPIVKQHWPQVSLAIWQGNAKQYLGSSNDFHSGIYHPCHQNLQDLRISSWIRLNAQQSPTIAYFCSDLWISLVEHLL